MSEYCKNCKTMQDEIERLRGVIEDAREMVEDWSRAKENKRGTRKMNDLVSLGDLVEVKTYIQNKGWEWLGLIGTVTSVGDEKRCYRVNYGDVYSFYDSDQIRKANSDISR